LFVECYNKSQEIVLLQVYDRSMSQNSCARTDIILKRGSRTRQKQQQQQTSSNNNEQQQEIPLIPALPPSAMMMMGIKQEERTLSVCLYKKKNKFFSNFWIVFSF
jgi:hypothetical protein